MESYCVSYKKNTKNGNSGVEKKLTFIINKELHNVNNI